MSQTGGPKQPGDRAAAAAYVAELVADLVTLARHYRLDTLGYILDMAQLEAQNVKRDSGGQR